MTAPEVRDHLLALRAERALALATGRPSTTATLSGLDEQIHSAETALTGIAVTEIATLHGELSGRPQG